MEKLVSGSKYQVRYQEPGKRIMREAVAVYLETVDNDSLWDLRPLAGTARMPVSWVKSARPVDRNTGVYFNRKISEGAYTFEVTPNTRTIRVDEEVYVKLHGLALPGESVRETLHRVLIDEKVEMPEEGEKA